ncbi:MAG: chemotaxis protein CheW [Gammaproteobacteria bacterium]
MVTRVHPVYQAMLDARAELDASIDERRGTAGAVGIRCISFRVGEELYAVELAAVREVIVPPAAVPVPGAGHEIVGVINLRGNVVTVMNSRAMLGLVGTPRGPHARVLVLDHGGEWIGALVDAVEDIIRVDPAALEPPGPTNRRGAASLRVRGTLAVGSEIIFVVEPEALVGGMQG